jgi:hypothetical protein
MTKFIAFFGFVWILRLRSESFGFVWILRLRSESFGFVLDSSASLRIFRFRLDSSASLRILWLCVGFFGFAQNPLATQGVLRDPERSRRIQLIGLFGVKSILGI